MRDMKPILDAMPFVRNHGIEFLGSESGITRLRMPYDHAWSTPPGLFPTAMIGMIGDIAAVSACFEAAPDGHACATLDFTIKMTGPASGDELVAEGRVLSAGKTTSVGAADIYAVTDGERKLCGTLLATARVFRLGPEVKTS